METCSTASTTYTAYYANMKAMSRSRYSLLFVVVMVVLASRSSTRAFVSRPPPPSREHRYPRLLFLRPHQYQGKMSLCRRSYSILLSLSSSNNHENEEFDADAARRQLESLLLGQTKEATITSVASLLACVQDDNVVAHLLPSPPPPLTSADRERRLTEIQLLKQLAGSDENNNEMALQLLWELWFSERGATAKKQLEQADAFMSEPSHWSKCEVLLSNMIQEHGAYFTEPINRLATLYYLQGRYEESYRLCLVVLHSKPWHVGALSGIFMVCAQLSGDRRRDKARQYWSGKRLLPTTTTNRQEWVNRAVSDAEDALEQAEKWTRDSFWRLDDDNENFSSFKQKEPDAAAPDDDDGAWQ